MTLALLAQPVDLSPTTGANIVFVGGLHRSGTSLLAGALGSAKRATGLVRTGFAEDEGHYLHSVIPSAHQLGGPGRFAFHPEANLGPASMHLLDRSSNSLDELATDLGVGPVGSLNVRQPSEGPSYDDQWRAWRKTSAARRAERTWLPMAEAGMNRWGYSIDDRLV